MAAPPERGFLLDEFQLQAMEALSEHRSVLVAAPTGSGKTVIAEHAIELALAEGARAFYTSPIKALANQKFRDFRDRYGADAVGLLTGDNAINGGASIVVMTTEVLRNMLYERSRDLATLRWVILDEVHYLQDRWRGPVWEEVILHLDPSVTMVGLSATVSNLDELRDWFEAVRGPTELIVTYNRPVPLEQMLGYSKGRGQQMELMALLLDGVPNSEGHHLDVPASRRYGKNRGGGRRTFTPRRHEVVTALVERDLGPLIYFIFSRAGCDDAVRQCSEAGLIFTTNAQRDRIRTIVDQHLSQIEPADRRSLQLDAWRSAFERGIASHHAGMVPAAKEAVERAFSEGLVAAVFATETLALGINMPARSVVIENLSKFNGEGHQLLTPLEYTQLTGRAGRRGKDDLGTAITLWSPHVEFADVAGLAGSRSYEVKSAFKPTYNMAVNLVGRFNRPAAHEVLGRSLAQFQVDRAAVVMRSDMAATRRRLAKAVDAARCEHGDVREYQALLGDERRQRDGDATPEQIAGVLADLRPGDILADPTFGRSVVLSSSTRKAGPRVRVVFSNGSSSTLDVDDFGGKPVVEGRVDLPVPFRPNDEAFHNEVADTLFDANITSGADAHPVAACPKLTAHLRAIQKVGRLESKLGRTQKRIDSRGAKLVEEFDRVIDVLIELGYVVDSTSSAGRWQRTPEGDLLSMIYTDGDLLLAEAIDEGLFDGLGAPELAAVVSTITYEPRSTADAEPDQARLPKRADQAVRRLSSMASELQVLERRMLGTATTPNIERGFAATAHRWAEGSSLAPILEDMSAGEFVRNIKQLVDLLSQIADVAPDNALAEAANEAVDALHRGVIRSASMPAPSTVATGTGSGETDAEPGGDDSAPDDAD